jgi:flagellar protein FliS
MAGNGAHRGMNDYRWTDQPSLADASDPHGLVQLMLDGAVARVLQAQGALENGDTPLKCELIGKAVNLIEGLRACLDETRGGEIAGNLAALYDYMARRLVAANAFGDATILREVASLLREIQTGWREMGELLEVDRGRSDGAAEAAR